MISFQKPSSRIDVALDLRLAGYRRGGITRYARELRAALAHIEDVNIRPLRSRRDREVDARALYLATPPHHRFDPFAIPLELLLHRAWPDVYHATDFIAPILPGVACVATVHDLAFVRRPSDLTPDALVWQRRLRSAMRRTSAWIVPSHWTADDLATIYGARPSSIHVIPHGVSLGLLDEAPLPRCARGDFVLAVGTVEPRKRYDLLLDAIETAPELPTLIVAGQPGWNSADVERRLRGHGRVTWLLAADDATVRRLYRQAIAVVVPSHAEGFGLTALEAMACGTPVISSGGGALREVTRHAAVEPDADSPEGWADTIGRVASDGSLWERLSESGRAVASGFTWERAALATAEVYRDVAQR